MGKRVVIRGPIQFGDVITQGRKVSVRLLRASYLASEYGGVVRCGVSIARHTGNAVRRNRIRRLIRESIRLEGSEFQTLLGQTGVGVDIVFRFRSVGVPPLRQLSLQHIKPEVRKIFGTIATRMNQGAS